MKQNTGYIIMLTSIAALGGLLFGYDTAVISGAEQSLQIYLIDSLGLGTFAHGLTVSSALIGCIIGGLISGFLSNNIGRRNSLLLAAVFFFISAVLLDYSEFIFFIKVEHTFVLYLVFYFYVIVCCVG